MDKLQLVLCATQYLTTDELVTFKLEKVTLLSYLFRTIVYCLKRTHVTFVNPGVKDQCSSYLKAKF